MKKIYCDIGRNDFVSVRFYREHVELSVWEDGEANAVFLSPAKIRELLNLLKKALLQIEGVKDEAEGDWFSPGKKVVITGNSNSHEFPIGTIAIIRESVSNDKRGKRCEHLDGHEYWFVRQSDCKPYTEDEA